MKNEAPRDLQLYIAIGCNCGLFDELPVHTLNRESPLDDAAAIFFERGWRLVEGEVYCPPCVGASEVFEAIEKVNGYYQLTCQKCGIILQHPANLFDKKEDEARNLYNLGYRKIDEKIICPDCIEV